jgi:hypothetical protein
MASPVVAITPPTKSKLMEERFAAAMREKEASRCVLQSIACGQTIHGSLDILDCPLSTGEVVDFFQFQGRAGEVVSGTLSSSSFTPFLDLLDPTPNSVAFNSGPGSTQVQFRLDSSGVWTWGVTNADGFLELGPYTLEFQCGTSSCPPGSLCLDSGRFRVAATWMNQFDGTSGTAHAIPSTDSTGFFYFTDPTNYELVVKILNIDGVIKVFYTELTNLKFIITVTDTRDGTAKTYENTPGDCGAIDENAFTAAATARRVAAGHGLCAPGSNTLCLLNRRFAVNVDWMNQFNNTSGLGSPRSLSDQSGLFSFTDPTDVELVMKVVDFGDRTAFFWGALSDFAYDISVTDTLGGTTKTYHNAAGSYCGGLDNNAFPP